MVCKKCGKTIETGGNICKECQAQDYGSVQMSNNPAFKVAESPNLMIGYIVAAISMAIYIFSVIGFFFFPLVTFEAGNFEKARSFAGLCVGKEFKIFFSLLNTSTTGGASSTNVQFIASLTFICFVCIAISVIMILAAVIKIFLKDIRFSCRMSSYSVLFMGLLRLVLVLISKMICTAFKEELLIDVHTSGSLYFMMIFLILSFLSILWLAETYVQNPKKY